MSERNGKAVFLQHFSKVLCFFTLFLIFAGGLVKSTNSGLAVPDWPLSYGSFFPPMVGGVFYEHGHRMIATLVGFITLCAAVLIAMWDERKWLKTTAWIALGGVILQGVFGGLTVLFFLPDWISISHGLLAQSFFCLTIFMAYALSTEREERQAKAPNTNGKFIRISLIFIGIIFVQLFLGALMRHTESGLAIPDFPKMGGFWWPPFNELMLSRINAWRFSENLDPVTLTQVWMHFFHRLGAVFVVIGIAVINFIGLEAFRNQQRVVSAIFFLDLMVALQILLGIITIYLKKEPVVTSLHVVLGAAILGMSVLLLLRVSPVRWAEFKRLI